MMTEPNPPETAREAVNLDRKFLEASAKPRGDWGNLSMVILDDDEEDDDAGE
jgi:hypothetical protein